MKFTDGLWLHQPGVTAHYAAEAYEAARDGDDLIVYATTQVVRHRGQTLQGPLLTLRLSAVLPGIIKVRVEHYSGGLERGPKIPLQTLPAMPAEISIGESEASITSGSITARVGLKTGGWELRFESGGRVLTRSGWRNLGYAQWAERGNFLFEQLSLEVGECVYGFGERFTAFVKNGQVVENTNKDGGTSSDQAYKAVPFYLTNRGYGVLVNETGPVSFEVASEKTNRAQFSISGESLEYFVIDGPTPREVIEKLTALTGRPALPPAWSFGLWLTTSFVTNYDEATCTGFIEEMKTRDLPLHVFHFDCFWMREFNWCDFAVGSAHVSRSCRDAPPPARARTQDLRLDQSLHRAAVAAFRRRQARRISAQENRRRRLADATSGSRAWASWISPIPPRANGMPATCGACSTWAWIASRRTSASAFPPMSRGTTAPTREGMHNHYSVLYNEMRLRHASRRREARARPSCSRARPTPPGSGFPCTGAATAGRASSPWPRACAAGFPSASAASGSGATTSAASRATAARRSINAGSPSACSPRTAACTATPATASPGPTTRKPATCCGNSPSSSAASCPTFSRRPSRLTKRAARCCAPCCSNSPTIPPATRSTANTCSATRCSSRR